MSKIKQVCESSSSNKSSEPQSREIVRYLPEIGDFDSVKSEAILQNVKRVFQKWQVEWGTERVCACDARSYDVLRL